MQQIYKYLTKMRKNNHADVQCALFNERAVFRLSEQSFFIDNKAANR